MNLTEVQALITYVNQIDARIQVNMPTAEVWHLSLAKYPLEHARYAAMIYYAYTSSDDGAGMPALTPGILRRRIQQGRDEAHAKRQAIEASQQRWLDEIEAAKVEPPPSGMTRYQQLIAEAKSVAKPIPD